MACPEPLLRLRLHSLRRPRLARGAARCYLNNARSRMRGHGDSGEGGESQLRLGLSVSLAAVLNHREWRGRRWWLMALAWGCGLRSSPGAAGAGLGWALGRAASQRRHESPAASHSTPTRPHAHAAAQRSKRRRPVASTTTAAPAAAPAPAAPAPMARRAHPDGAGVNALAHSLPG